MGRAEAAGGDAMRGRFEVGARMAVKLRLLVVNLLQEVAIGAGSLRFERFRVLRILRRDLQRERYFSGERLPEREAE